MPGPGFLCFVSSCGSREITVGLDVAGRLEQKKPSHGSASSAGGELVTYHRKDFVRETVLVVRGRVYTRYGDFVPGFEGPIRHNVRPDGELNDIRKESYSESTLLLVVKIVSH